MTLLSKISPLMASLVLLASGAAASAPQATDTASSVFTAREQDWRNGAVVYQVLVDRFAPPADLQGKRALYPAPKVLHRWSEPARRGRYVEAVHLWSHELDFWGGDLPSLISKLGYVQDLGADVLYLNPIHWAYTNHKYDALDYMAVSPEFGTREDLTRLTTEVHAKGMKVVLDGVFNHMGRNARMFKEAQADPKSAQRDWFYFGDQYTGGARGWAKASNLPELNLENAQVRNYIYGATDSVVQSYLRNGIDGWRLDVAYELGPTYLAELTQAAHSAKPGSLVVGEIASYPKQWFPALDGVLNFTLRDIILNTVQQRIAPAVAARMIDTTIADAGIEPMLKSWLLLDNHDNDRLTHVLPKVPQQRMAQALQFTLPGSPNIYYGSELGMTGGEDPANRAPMRWELVNPKNTTLGFHKQMIALRKQHRALRVGNFRLIHSGELLAFERYTDRVQDSVMVLLNPGKKTVTERVLIPNSSLMNGGLLVDLLAPNVKPVTVLASMATVTLPPCGFRVLSPDVKPVEGYTPYKRMP